MTTDDAVLRTLAHANPEPVRADPPLDREAEELLARIVAEPDGRHPRHVHRRPRLQLLVPVGSVIVVLAVIAVLVGVGGRHGGVAGAGSARIVLRASPTPQAPRVTAAALRRELASLRVRLRTAGISGERAQLLSGDRIAVTLPSGGQVPKATQILTARSSVDFYDWEADVIAPDGRAAAAGLPRQIPTALALSQGASDGPGVASGAGALPLYSAVKLAGRQPAAPASPTLSRLGPQYYLFARTHTARCESDDPCLLAGPAPSARALHATVAGHATSAETRTLKVPQGTIVLGASGQTVSPRAPAARFFVLRDRVVLDAADVTDVRARIDPHRVFAVGFRFTTDGSRRFQNLTATLARRGRRNTVDTGAPAYQHFAIAYDGVLQAVPQLDFEVFPDGVIPRAGAGTEIAAGPSLADAQRLAAAMRLGDPPLRLSVLSTGH